MALQSGPKPVIATFVFCVFALFAFGGAFWFKQHYFFRAVGFIKVNQASKNEAKRGFLTRLVRHHGFTDEEKMGFAALVLAPIVITQALGKYHRVKGYEPDQVAKDFGYKPLPPGSSSNLLKDDKMNPLEAMGASMKGLMDSFNKPETPDKKRK